MHFPPFFPQHVIWPYFSPGGGGSNIKIYTPTVQYSKVHYSTVQCSRIVDCTYLYDPPPSVNVIVHVQCTMHNAQCTMYNVQCTMNNVQCTMYNVLLQWYIPSVDIVHTLLSRGGRTVNNPQAGQLGRPLAPDTSCSRLQQSPYKYLGMIDR